MQEAHRETSVKLNSIQKRLAWLFGFALLTWLLARSVWLPSDREVVVYTALDQEFAEPIFAEFTRQTGIVVRPKFDTESTKTVGLANALLAEAARPRADLFWNNEILNTLRLARRGLLEAYPPQHAPEFPGEFRDAGATWHGFAARARVLLVNTEQLAADQRPRSVEDLLRPDLAPRAGIAKPLFGTTATHAACLFALWGPERAGDFFHKLRLAGIQVMAGNRHVAQAVASGQLACGLTDTDDAMVEIERGSPVEMIFPDQMPGQAGALFIPNTLSLLRGCPHPEAARKLADYLLSADVERQLAAGPSAQIPLHPDAATAARVSTPTTVRAMAVDFGRAAEFWDEAARRLSDEFFEGK